MDTAPNATNDLLAGKLAVRIDEAAQLLSLPSRTLRDHVKRGDIRGVRIGKGRRAITLIAVDELRRLLGGGK